MKNKLMAALVFNMLVASAQAQVYRCKGPAGVVMQQAPCPGDGQKLDVRPASGHMSADQAHNPSGQANPGSSVRPRSRTEMNIEVLQDERLRRDGWFDMISKRAALERQIKQCAIEQQRIGQERAYSNNNLAGATRDVSITTEMKAAAAICDTTARSFEREVDQAIAYCERIKCIAAN